MRTQTQLHVHEGNFKSKATKRCGPSLQTKQMCFHLSLKLIILRDLAAIGVR